MLYWEGRGEAVANYYSGILKDLRQDGRMFRVTFEPLTKLPLV